MTTPILGLDEIQESQASKFVTHNEALRRLEALLVRALSATTAAQPTSPADGDVYILPSGPTGADWGGFNADQIALYMSGAWVAIDPPIGLTLPIVDAQSMLSYDGSAWTGWAAAVAATAVSLAPVGKVPDTSVQDGIRSLSALTQARPLDKDLTAPPASPADGDLYIVGASATGAWSGHDDDLTIWDSAAAAWVFYPPQVGWQAWVADEALPYRYTVSGWAQDTAASGLSDAPSDGKIYGRQDAAWVEVPGSTLAVKAVTSTSYTFVAGDAGEGLEAANASAITMTIPPNASVAFPVGTLITVAQADAGQVTIAPGSGVTLNSVASTPQTRAQDAVISLWKVATDTWRVFGDLA